MTNYLSMRNDRSDDLSQISREARIYIFNDQLVLDFAFFFLFLKVYKQIVRKFFNSKDSCNSFSRTEQIDIINFASAVCRMNKIRIELVLETSAINLGSRYVRTRMSKSFYVSTGFVRELNKWTSYLRICFR